MKLKKKHIKVFKQFCRKAMAIFMAILLLFQTVAPYNSYALTGGPSQPEVQSFTPIGTSDMVNLFSGDFSYNIPLLSVDGYPINIAYNSGVTMDQEASWVGLGWNLNPGVINRQMRGIPDDFQGDTIHKEMYMKPNRTFGAKAGVGVEIAGWDGLQLGYSLGLNYNNYNGVGMDQGFSVALSIGDKSKGALNLGLGLNSSSNNGLSISPSAGFSREKTKILNKDGDHSITTLGFKLGTSFNSRAGLKQLSITGYKDVQRVQMNAGKNKDQQVKYPSSTNRSANFDFGTPTYIPSVNLSRQTFAASGRFTAGGEIFIAHGNGWIEGYLSSEWLRDNETDNPAYGYMHTDLGQDNPYAIHDFNREKDGIYMPTTPALGLVSYTHDVYSMAAQGAGGSFRTMRNDVGYVYDVKNQSTSDDFSLGAEIGGGNTVHVGVDVAVHSTNTRTHNWENDNDALQKLKSRSTGDDISYEKFYFKSAGDRTVEKNPNFIASMGGYEPVHVDIEKCGDYCVRAVSKFEDYNGSTFPIPKNYKENRDGRSQSFAYLTNDEKQTYGIEQSIGAYPGHHIGEISSVQPGGARYVYGQPAYNNMQEEVTFSIDDGNGNCNTGLASYSQQQSSIENRSGRDHYYTSVNTPAYAHSYLLTSVLSNDYVDVDGIDGPSDNDIGNYTRFTYKTVSNYAWRTPFDANKATYNEGLKSDPNDDKASFIYGQKDLYYLDTIVTKNHIAIFHTSDRNDAHAVAGRDGGVDNSVSMQKLDSISLYSKPDYIASNGSNPPLKRVHFRYDYSLCQQVPNNPNQNEGKLTLTSIFFTHQGSNKARFSPYNFEYNGLNPNYDPKGYDRWGCYKPSSSAGCAANAPLTNAEFPYVDQDKALADQYTSAWTLTNIGLPSGGKINVDYESDDYAYVQHKRAQQMFKVVGIGGDDINNPPTSSTSISSAIESKDLNGSGAGLRPNFLIFELQDGYNNIDDYFEDIDLLYFRFLTQIKSSSGDPYFDYVSGYGEVESGVNAKGVVNIGGTDYGYVKMKGIEFKSTSNREYSPASMAAINLGSKNLSKLMNSQPGVDPDQGLGADILNAILGSSFLNAFDEGIRGYYTKKYQDNGCGEKFKTHKSWIKLNNPSYAKLGGNCRVKKITSSDEWANMTPANSGHRTMEYGQEYYYTLEDGTSSGVASYEPHIGGDENPWKKPIFFEKENLLVPDEQFYLEEPFGESFFPTPSVGYSRVIVQNLQRQNVNRHATGKVEHEFFTAKDFPTYTKRTEVDDIPQKTDPFSIASLLNLASKDHMTVSQGFYIELNDMHGKAKGKKVYQEDKTTPISSVAYKYQSQPYLDGHQRVSNNATVIHPDGSSSVEEIGVFHDMVVDFRHQQTNFNSYSGAFNLETFFTPPVPWPWLIPMLWPKINKEETRFRSTTTTKVVQKMGLLEEVIAEDLGSVVSTKNLAYDAETGEVLLTQTITDFNDHVYALKFPANWYYKQLGNNYKNVNMVVDNMPFNQNGEVSLPNADKYFSEGDELAIAGGEKAWVTHVDHNSFTATTKDNSPASGSNYRVMRSGNKNAPSTAMAEITTRENPINSIQTNTYEKVLAAGATEYTDVWRTYCDCFADDIIEGNNPYAVGRRGNWRVKRSQSYLTERSRSNYNNNTNIREDGLLTSFKPFYKVQSDGTWVKDIKNWVFTSEVSEYSPLGQELENRDALGRYSSAIFGFNGTLPTFIGANARHRESGFDSFEDYAFNPCIDGHFKFDPQYVSDDEAHSGWNSIKVASGTTVTMNKDLESCELEECLLEVDFASGGINSNVVYVEAEHGTAPYEYEWNVVSGFPVIMPWAANGGLKITGTGWTVDVIITDAAGCTAIRQYSTKSPYEVEIQDVNYEIEKN
ncbi:MAG: hypothetical protein MRY83_25140 [Flavobacteriales bacterium]|nr:hypothetical protein [Flavobacteriales bacterium]